MENTCVCSHCGGTASLGYENRAISWDEGGLLRLLGTPYYYFELIKQAGKLVTNKGKHFSRDGRTYFSMNDLLVAGERLICSALIDSVFEQVGLDLFPNRPPFNTTPADLASLATGSAPTFVVIHQYLPKI